MHLSEAEQILAILGSFYLLECLYWVRPGAVTFVTQFGFRFWPRSAWSSAFLRNDRGGLLLGNLLPFGTSTAGQSWPFSISPDGIYSHVASTATPDGRLDHTFRRYTFDEIRSISTEQRTLQINGHTFANLSSPPMAKHLAAFIQRVKDLPHAERAIAIENAIRETLDFPSAVERWISTARESGSLFFTCTILMLYVFVGLPILLQFETFLAARGIEFPWGQIAIGYVLLLLFLMIDFFIAHRKLLRSQTAERRKHMLMMLISPADALHSRDVVVRSSMELYHPLTLAAVFCSPRRFRQFAKPILLDLRYPLSDAIAESDDIERWYRGRLSGAIYRLMEARGVDVNELFAVPPMPLRTLTYCVRCHGGFEIASGMCTLCERPLLKIGQVESPAFDVPKAIVSPPVVASPPPPEPVAKKSALNVKKSEAKKPKSKKKRNR